MARSATTERHHQHVLPPCRAAVIIGAVNVVSTFVSILTVDKFGRRFLFLQGGIQMACAQVRGLGTRVLCMRCKSPAHNGIVAAEMRCQSAYVRGVFG